MAAMIDPFAPTLVGGLALRNRISMAPMTRRFCPSPALVPGEDVVEYYALRAKLGVGLIVTEGVHIDGTHSVDAANTPGLYKKEHAQAWKKVTDAVHSFGSKMVIQLWHTGPMALDPIGPIAFFNPHTKKDVKAMTLQDLEDVKQSFVNAAVLAKEAGFAGAQLHFAHGYLGSAFLAPTNNRTDGYGGSFENRMRFPLEIVAAIRKQLVDFHLQVRISQWWDFAKYDDRSYDVASLKLFVTKLEELGVNIIDVSTHKVLAPAFPELHPTRTLAGFVKSFVKCGVISVGGVCGSHGFLDQIRKSDFSVETVSDYKPALNSIGIETDILAIGRALLSNPNLVQLMQRGASVTEIIPFDIKMRHSLL